MSDVERALVAGASGDTGRELLSVLSQSDLEVRATTRSYADVPRLERLGADDVVVVNLFESADAVRAVKDCDVVYCTVGSPVGIRHVLGGKLVDRTGVINLLTASIGADADHFVYQSAIGVGNSRRGMALPFRLLVRGSLQAKGDSETALRRSGLDYTIVRPGKLTDDPPTSEALVGEGGDSVSGSIPRADVAQLMAAAPFTSDARNRTFEVVSRDGVRESPKNLVDVEWAFDRVGIDESLRARSDVSG